jgi:galactosylceramidase
LDDIPVTDGKFQFNAEPSAIYSLTTLTTPAKGVAAPPPSKPFPFSYKEDFESYRPGSTPRYFSDYSGAFEVAQRTDGTGRALRQVISTKGVEWQKNAFPETFLGI